MKQENCFRVNTPASTEVDALDMNEIEDEIDALEGGEKVEPSVFKRQLTRENFGFMDDPVMPTVGAWGYTHSRCGQLIFFRF